MDEKAAIAVYVPQLFHLKNSFVQTVNSSALEKLLNSSTIN